MKIALLGAAAFLAFAPAAFAETQTYKADLEASTRCRRTTARAAAHSPRPTIR